jgi:glycosyltransferase involved in cell wall biosynthesis
MTRYSVCMLCSNDAGTVSQSISSLLDFCRNNDAEIVVVDNASRDGSITKLETFRAQGLLSYVSRKCSRGVGRQIAFSMAKGHYIIAHMDTDDIFSSEGLEAFVKKYHEKYEGKLLMSKRVSNVTIAPRQLIEEIGGWRDVNWVEDWDVYARAARVGKFVLLPYDKTKPIHLKVTIRAGREKKLLYGYRYRRDCIRIGKRTVQTTLIQKAVYAMARIGVFIQRSKLYPQIDPNWDKGPTT